jgi:4-amino-4-deoxy-L-arabinose transferase-like glycosyltransferase
VRSLPRPRPELAALVLLAGTLNLWALSRNGYANEYYSAAVSSMTSSWHNFIFGSFDASGVMTVDKPPLALWVQAASAKAFGLSSWSMLVPQALMGAGAVALVYDLTRRPFGRAAGFAAGLTLALTPATVAISRHNNPDALLVLCCAAALWFVVRALEDRRTRWIVLAGVSAGLGFEAKMGVALMVVPGIALAWLWIAPRGRVAALRQLAAGGAAMVAVGGAWPLLVALTPASGRPWISGTADNSIWSLIFGYNGLGRITGQSGGPGAMGGGPGGGGPGGGTGPFGGSSGVLRLLNQSLGGQAGWLLGFAIVGGISIAIASRLRRTDARTGWLIAVGGSFAITAVAFSFAGGIFHPYYVSLLAPFAAALVGAGAATLAGQGRAVRVLAPLALAGGVAAELKVLADNPGQLGWLPPLLVIGAGGAAVALAAVGEARIRAAVLAAALGLLLVAPATWAVETLGHPTSGTFPTGGPASAATGGGPGGRIGRGGRPGFARGGPGFARGGPGGPPPGMAGGAPPPGTASSSSAPPSGGFAPPGGAAGGGPAGGPFGGSSASLNAVARYVDQNGGGTIAVSSQMQAAGAILQTKASIAAIGGFSGRESEVSTSWLADAVQSGKIRWVLTGGQMGGLRGDTRVGARSVMASVANVCTSVPSARYTSSSTGSAGSGTLYDCLGKAAALRAAG